MEGPAGSICSMLTLSFLNTSLNLIASLYLLDEGGGDALPASFQIPTNSIGENIMPICSLLVLSCGGSGPGDTTIEVCAIPGGNNDILFKSSATIFKSKGNA